MSYFNVVHESGHGELAGITDVVEIAHEAHQIALSRDFTITFKDEDGTKIQVAADSNPELIIRDWRRARRGYLGQSATVGPYPADQLTEAELQSDEEIHRAKTREQATAASRLEAEDRTNNERTRARLEQAPEIEFADEEAKNYWKSVKDRMPEGDDYGRKAVEFAHTWARLMQLDLAEGKQLKDIWQSTHRETDLLVRGAGSAAESARNLLVRAWKHRAELKRLWPDT